MTGAQGWRCLGCRQYHETRSCQGGRARVLAGARSVAAIQVSTFQTALAVSKSKEHLSCQWGSSYDLMADLS
jgi:hypothetical protein